VCVERHTYESLALFEKKKNRMMLWLGVLLGGGLLKKIVAEDYNSFMRWLRGDSDE